MKKLLLLLLLVVGCCYGQKCDVKTSTDEFSKKSVSSTDEQTICSMYIKVKTKILRADSTYVIKFSLGYAGYLTKILMKQNKVQLLLENGNVVDLYPIKDCKGEFEASTTAPYTKLTIMCDLVKGNLDILGKEKIKKVRVNLVDQIDEFEIKEKNRNKIPEMISCIQKP